MDRSNGFPPGQREPSGPRPTTSGQARPPPTPNAASQSNTNRAQRFESEKQRIQESCFAKLDENGQQAESYITHLRVEEDGAYPSMPPPADAAAENKKARVIIVSVKTTGRVRIHKARENHNGSFSIGKTWNMEDVSAVESFTHVAPNASQQRRQYCQLAGTLGFTVTMGKPYYWRAGTAKERDFFIASLVKIYRKYTKGRVPELIGFEDRERDQILGPGGGQPPQQQRPPPGPLSPTPGQQATGRPPPRPASRDTDGRSASIGNERGPQPSPSGVSPAPLSGPRRYPPPQASPDGRPMDPSQLPYSQQRRPSQEPRRPSDQGLGIRNFSSSERLRQPSIEGYQGNGMRRPSREGLAGQDRLRRPSPENLQAPAIPPQGPGRNGRASPQSATGGPFPRGPSPAGSQLSIPSNSSRQQVLPLRSGPDDGRTNGAPKDRMNNNKATQQAIPVPPMDRNGSMDSRGEVEASDSPPKPAMLPERRRPPLNLRELTPTIPYENDDLKPPPLSTARSAASASPTSPAPPGTFVETPAISPLPTEDQSVGKLESRPTTADTSRTTESGAVAAATATPEFQTPEGQTPDGEKTEEDAAKPGLGPMFKKRDVAAAFRRAATAANAFKPRAGGAGDRLKKLNDTPTDQDGVHGVVPAPLRGLDTSRNNSVVSAVQSDKAATPILGNGSEAPSETASIASVSIAKEVASTESLQISPSKMSLDGFGSADQDGKPALKQKRRTAQQEKYLASLGLDPALFETKGLEFELILSEFGWGSDILQPNRLEQMETDIKREIGRVEAGSWLSHVEQKDDRVGLVDRMLDRAIAECDELDGLLTLYSVELSTLNEDISFIEAQSQGLQVQTANQKILQAELQNLVDTISITPDQLAALQQGSFDTELDLIESTLVVLYQAMLTIDPSIKSTATEQLRGKDGSERSELANMHALQERRDAYLEESDRFCRRVVSRLGTAFDTSLNQAIPSLLKPAAGQKGPSWKLHAAACNAARAGLWQYSPLMLYTKEVNSRAWRHLLNTYTDVARPLYQTVFRTALDSHRKNVRAPTGDEADVLFTSAEREPTDGLALATRKLTMKRSQTLARSTRTASGEKAKALQAGRQLPYEAFADMLTQWAPTLAMEQNFVVELFHATSLENLDFVDAVQALAPEQRRGPADLLMPKISEPDRNVADQVQRAMQTIFDFWLPELLKLVDQSTSNDPIQSVGMMAAIAVYSAPLHETSQDYLLRSLIDTSAKLGAIFNKFIDTQVHAIEETKVLLKKRKGVISFIRTFPHFSTALENVFSGGARNTNNAGVYDVRQLVDDAYERINQSMWAALKQIAKDTPAMSTAAGTAESEDKQILNHHILLIENMNHYIEEVDDRGDARSVLATWKTKAVQERGEHLDQYVSRVVRRPLGKLLDFIESTESLLSSTTGPPSSIASKPSHSRPAAKRAFAAYDSREVRKGIDALRKRVEKHFDPTPSFDLSGGADANGDDRAVAQKLVVLVLDACEARYFRTLERAQRIVSEVYPVGAQPGEKGVELEWGRDDVLLGFKREGGTSRFGNIV